MRVQIAGLRQRSMSDNRKPTAEVVYDRERGSTVPLKSVVSESVRVCPPKELAFESQGTTAAASAMSDVYSTVYCALTVCTSHLWFLPLLFSHPT